MKWQSAGIVVFAVAVGAGCTAEPTGVDAASLAPRSVQVVLPSPGVAVYDNLPSPTPGNVPSLGFECCSTAEFGDHIELAGTARRAHTATVLMSSWSLHSTYPTMDAAGYLHPITLNLYQVNTSGPLPTLGALIGSVTQTFLIPWRPEADPTCGTAWKASNGSCYNGYAFTIEFDLRGLALTLPNQFIFGVAYNTQHYGATPIGQPGPYNSLNVGTVAVSPSVGVDVEPIAAFWNTSFAGFYDDGGAGGVGTFRRDAGWAGLAPAVRFAAFTPATTIDGCKANGWKNLARADATPFANQGDCVSYIQNGK